MNKLINSPQNLGATPPLEYIQASKDAGYDAIGIRLYRAPGRTYNFDPIVGNPALMRDVKSAIANSGLEMWDIFSIYLRPEMEWDLILPAMDYAGELRAKYVLVIGDDPEWTRMCESMGRLCDKVAPMGMTVVVEATVNALSPLQVATKFMEDSKRANVGICLDPCQTFRDHGSFDVVKEVDAKWLPYMQINDTLEIGKMGAQPGTGLIPLGDLLDVMPANIPLSVEAQLRDNSYTGAQWAKKSVESTRAFLEKYYASKK